MVVVVGSYHHSAAMPVATQTIREALGEPATVGITSAGVLAGPDEFHSGPTLAALAIGGPEIRARSFTLDVHDGPPEVWSRPLVRSRLKPASPPKLIAVFADPFTAGSNALTTAFEAAVPPGTPIMGGLVSGGSQAGTNVLVADDQVQNTGVVKSQGCAYQAAGLAPSPYQARRT